MTSGTTAETAAPKGEPEPIEADFEPATAKKGQRRPPGAPQPRRSRAVSHRDVMIASTIAGSLGAAAGAVIAIVASGAGSGASTGTLAQEIDSIRSNHAELSARADQVGNDLVTMRSRIDTQADRLNKREDDDAALRVELAAINGQLSALLGDGTQPAGTPASSSPLGALLSRINRLENVLSADASAPTTSRQMQRAVADLSAQVTALAEAQAQYTAATNKRQMAFDALENGLDRLANDVAALRSDLDQTAQVKATARRPAISLAPVVAGADSRAIRALSALEAQAASGGGFLAQQQALAGLLPSDPDVTSLGDFARDGAPTLDDLRRDFVVSARNAERISAVRQDDGWNWLRGAIAGAAPGDADAAYEAAALIAEARRALEGGDVGAAVEAVDDMEGPSAAAFGLWRQAAARRAELDDRIATLSARLGGAPG